MTSSISSKTSEIMTRRFHFSTIKQIVTATAILVAVTSCSDDNKPDPDNNKTYPVDVRFTQEQSPVVVADASDNSETTSFDIAFEAASNWQVSAKDLLDHTHPADWVSFSSSTGEEGSHKIGAKLATNQLSEERAAIVEIACNGKSVSFTVVQKSSSPVPNPNEAYINPGKVVSKVEYFSDFTPEYPIRTSVFTYDQDKRLTAVTITNTHLQQTETSTLEIATEGNTNKVTFTTRGNLTKDGGVYAIVNGKAVIGYPCLSVVTPSDIRPLSFGYNPQSLYSMECADFNYALRWADGNLAKIQCYTSPTTNYDLSYSTLPNDYNIDINYLIGYMDVWTYLYPGFGTLAMMNLVGTRSINLAESSYGTTGKYSFTSGVTTESGETVNGITATEGTTTIKIYLAD